ncbi:killer toxin Kp4/SMK [Truncatella angustata]|uniref:Killer toxin Kp4/SMK n=1 Tax=Truncatella angustata TaxID=152316 RepID=A0A9P9A0L2_9PEZI|nr:killer toxin Kp4/SMK [Truncatella angustata]KAH6658517.1 killer toxin Kp4/SMK [Truncatella angustata]
MQPTLFLATLGLATSTLGLGINCRGNSNCGGTLCSLTDILRQVRSLPQGNQYRPGDHISCCGDNAVASGLCAFVQGNFHDGTITAARAGDLLQDLVNHGCGKCGSIPIGPNNDPDANGILTVNWVSQR